MEFILYNYQFRLTEPSHSVTITVIVRYSSNMSAFCFLPMNKSPQLDAVANPFLAERINGWAAMLGFFAVTGAYLTTGQIIPGVV